MGILLIISAIFYGLQIVIFHDTHDTSFYIFQDLGFLPVSIAVTTFIVGALLDRQNKQERIEASRILTVSFFSVMGNSLMDLLCSALDDQSRVKWDSDIFDEILTFLDDNTSTVLTIASNPNLLEHEKFTDLLWSVLHLREELYSRKDEEISHADQLHIVNDAQRVFDLYLENWNEYSEYTKAEYPYFVQSKSFLSWAGKVEEIAKKKSA